MLKKDFTHSCLIGFAALAGLCLVTTAILFVINTTQPAPSTQGDQLSGLDEARLGEAFHLQETLGEAVMPGWARADIPLIVFNDAYMFLVGCAEPADGWIKIPQDASLGTAWELVPGDDFYGQPYYRQKLPANNKKYEAFTVLVGDRWVASLGTYDWMRSSASEGIRKQLPRPLRPILPEHLIADLLIPGSDAYVSLVLHEAIHAYQGMQAPEKLADAERVYGQFKGQYPYEEKAFRDAWQVELNLLHQAMRATTPEETQRLAKAFLEQRARRRQAAKLSGELTNLERLKEWEEGIAKYGERTIYLLAANSRLYEPLPEANIDPEFNEYRKAHQKWDQEVDQMRRMAGDDGDGRFYYSGFAQAVLLDRLDPGWKDRLFSNGVWLEDLLAQAVY